MSATWSQAGWTPPTVVPRGRAIPIVIRFVRKRGRGSGCEPLYALTSRRGFLHPQLLRPLAVFIDEILDPDTRDSRERFRGARLGEQTHVLVAVQNLAVDFVKLQVLDGAGIEGARTLRQIRAQCRAIRFGLSGRIACLDALM